MARMSMEERIYEMRLLRERVPSELLPLFDHLLNLARDSYKRGYPQRAGRELRKAKNLTAMAHSSYYDPRAGLGHMASRKRYGLGSFRYLNRDRARKRRGRRTRRR